jgi:hypothetical protein
MVIKLTREDPRRQVPCVLFFAVYKDQRAFQAILCLFSKRGAAELLMLAESCLSQRPLA